MKKPWAVFLAGVLTGIVIVSALLVLTETQVAEAQTPHQLREQIVLMREMSASLKGIEQALQTRCP